MSPRCLIREQVTSRYGRLVVQQVGRRVDLEVAGATFASWHPDLMLTGYSWDAMTAGALLGASGTPSALLLLGLGGGTVSRQLRHLLPRLEITGIEIDDAVLRLGRAYLGLEEQDVDTIVDDAYVWLRHARRRFDVIADDIFLSGPEDVERPARPTVQHVRDLALRLKPGGLLAANYIITGPHTETYHQARQSFQTVFSDVAVVIPPRGYNRILVGGSALAGATALGMHRDRFRRARDRALWDRLRVERVP